MKSKFFASHDVVWKTIRHPKGDLSVGLREMTERERKSRENKLLDPMTGRGRKGTPGLRLDRQRAFDFETCLVDWDLTDDETGEKIPVSKDVLNLLPSSLTDRIYEHIREMNELPEDDEIEGPVDELDEDDSDSPNGEVVEMRSPKVVENPT